VSSELISPDERITFIFPDFDPSYDPELDTVVKNLGHNFGQPKPKSKPKECVADSCFSPAQVGLQFKCGNCLKKAVAFGDKASLEYNFIYDWRRVLVLEWVKIKKAEKILITTYCGGNVVAHEVVHELKVTGEYHCNGETDIIELNPDSPESSGLSKLAFEIDCGAVCKKVSNVDFVFDGGPLLSLFPPEGQSLIVQSFAAGKLFNKQCVGEVIVEKNKIVSREKSAIQVLHTY